MKNKLYFLLLLIGLLACSKDSFCDESFCVRINGKKWWPSSGGDFKSHPLAFHLIEDNNQFWIGAHNGPSSVMINIIDKVNGIKPGNYILDDRMCCWGSYGIDSKNRFRTDANNTGVLSITSLDKTKKTISGTFHFRARNASTGEVVEVSHGSFNGYYVEY